MEKSNLTGEVLLQCLIVRKEELSLTNAVIAEKSGVPESTVTKVFNGTNRSPTYDTIAPIARVLGVSLDTLSAVTEPLECREISSIKDSTRNADERLFAYIIASNEARIRTKDRWIKFLAIALVAVLAWVLAFMAYDYTHPDVGWVRYTTSITSNITFSI